MNLSLQILHIFFILSLDRKIKIRLKHPLPTRNNLREHCIAPVNAISLLPCNIYPNPPFSDLFVWSEIVACCRAVHSILLRVLSYFKESFINVL